MIQDVFYGSYKSSSNNMQHPSLSVTVNNINPNKTCTVNEAVRTVEEKCHGKNECQIIVEPSSFVIEFGDPCPDER